MICKQLYKSKFIAAKEINFINDFAYFPEIVYLSEIMDLKASVEM
jgi:hypothetical protein